ncbi:MAG: DUF2806 domain-containing protein [Ruminococcaceae bacterium]|nr:DUF2806 domain-containing protein [Oscillospiraceae bacterium]
MNIELPIENALDRFVPSFDTVVHWFNTPKEEARLFFLELVKDNNQLTDKEKIALIYNSRKAIREFGNCKSIYENAINIFRNNNQNITCEEIDGNTIDVDWLELFFDKAKLVNNKDLQIIWSNILANKMEKPDSINPSLIHTLSIISTEQANFFCNISRFCFEERKSDIVHPLIFIKTNKKAYENSGITDQKLRELHRLGLIEYNPEKEFVFENKKTIVKGNFQIDIYGDENDRNIIKAGNVFFTQDGLDLYSIVGSDVKKYRNDILDFTVERLIHRKCKVYINGKAIIF